MKKLILLLLLLVCVLMSPLTAYAAQTPSGIPFSELEAEIDALVVQHLGQTTPGVAVVVVHEGEIIFSKGYGYADTTRGILIDPATTIFEYGSIGKLFTWVSVMQLVERGLLDLDADAAYYLPADFAAQLAFEKPFTMRNLLNHQAGFGEHFFDVIFDANAMTDPIALREGLLMAQPMQIYTPGTVTAYSNFGTALAGYVVANINNQSFAAFEMENILRPLGMENTLNAPDWFNNHAFLEAKAIGYDTDGRGGFAEMIWAYFPIYPAGAINGTAEDLARFAKALTPSEGESGPLFESVDTLSRIFTPSSLDHDNFPGTYHGFLHYISALPAFGHGGDSAAFSTNMVVVPEARFGMVVLTNVNSEFDIRVGLPALLLGDNFDQIEQGPYNMPSVAEVEGTFLSARSLTGQFLAFLDFSFMPQLRVVAISDNEITVTIPTVGSARFVQTEPWVYQLAYYDHLILRMLLNEQISFRMENGRPVQVHVGNIHDFIEISTMRPVPRLVIGLVLAVMSILFFLIAPIVLLVRFWLNRKRSKENGTKWSHFMLFRNAMLLCCTVVVVNNLTSLVRILVIRLFRTSAEIAPHIWVNHIFIGIAVLMCAGAALMLRRENNEAQGKVLYFVITAMWAALIFVLADWNFFVFL